MTDLPATTDSLLHAANCGACRGTGNDPLRGKCSRCHGTGYELTQLGDDVAYLVEKIFYRLLREHVEIHHKTGVPMPTNEPQPTKNDLICPSCGKCCYPGYPLSVPTGIQLARRYVTWKKRCWHCDAPLTVEATLVVKISPRKDSDDRQEEEN